MSDFFFIFNKGVPVPRRKKKSLQKALNDHIDHHKAQVSGVCKEDDCEEGYAMFICSCGELVIYDRIVNSKDFIEGILKP